MLAGAGDHLATFSFSGVSQTRVKHSTWEQCPQVLAGKARKLPNRPVFAHMQLGRSSGRSRFQFMRNTSKKGQNSANKGLPLHLGRGVCVTKSKNGCSRPRSPLFLGFSVLRGGLRPWSRKGPDHGDPETVKNQGRKKTMTATDVTGFDAIFSTGFFATFSRF